MYIANPSIPTTPNAQPAIVADVAAKLFAPEELGAVDSIEQVYSVEVAVESKQTEAVESEAIEVRSW